MPKVLIADKMSAAARQAFDRRGVAADYRPGLGEAELMDILPAYDGLAVRSATKVRARLLEAGDRLKAIGRAGIGVDNIDVAAATRHGIAVMNTPHGNAVTTAEHAIAMLCALARQIPQADRSVHAGKWEKSAFLGTELYGKTLGVVGAGNIGALVIARAIGLGMKVAAFDPYLTEERARQLGCRKVELAELLAQSDFMTLHTPLTEQTKGLIGADNLAQVKDGALLVNCARGGLVDEAALKDALDSGKLGGAALDVVATEPPGESALLGHPRLIATPHLGAATGEAQEKVAVQVAEQLSDYLLDGAVTNALNMPAVSAEEAPRLKPYMTLLDQLGSLAGQIAEHAITGVELDFAGDAAGTNTQALAQVALAGLLRPHLDGVNVVSAPALAEGRGIAVARTHRDSDPDFHSLVRLTVTTEQRRRTVAGTLFAGSRPRLVDIEGVPVEAELSPHMLFVRNRDKPGFIGALGSTLGNAGVNIASFHLGRLAEAGHALALVAVDSPVDDAALSRVRALPHVEQARALAF